MLLNTMIVLGTLWFPEATVNQVVTTPPTIVLEENQPDVAQEQKQPFWKRPRTKAVIHTIVPILLAYGVEDAGEEAAAVLASYGALVGPSRGLFQTGESKRAWLGIGLRTAAALYAISNSSGGCNGLGECDLPNEDAEAGGGLIMLGSAIWDIMATPKRPAPKGQLTTKVMPSYSKDGASLQVRMRW